MRRTHALWARMSVVQPDSIQEQRPTPRVTVFTPSHRGAHLDECLESLLRQTFTDWEWVVLLNGGARWRPASEDPRIRVEVDDELTGVGAAKRRACLLSRGEFLVELDHDDVLASTALERVVEA